MRHKKKTHGNNPQHKKKFAFTRMQIGIISFMFGCGLVGLYVYTEEHLVALGGLIAHLWITALPVIEDA